MLLPYARHCSRHCGYSANKLRSPTLTELPQSRKTGDGQHQVVPQGPWEEGHEGWTDDSGAVLDRTGREGMMKKATCEQSSIFDIFDPHFKVLF